MWHDDGDRRQHSDERHGDAAKRLRGATLQRGTTTATGGTITARGSTATCGTTTVTGVSTATARGSRATGGTTMATGDTTRRHDEGNARQTTTIRCYVLSTLVLIFSYMSRSIMINHDPLNFIE